MALILVLGVLSLMLLLAASFAISMRTERLAAGNYTDSVRARHLGQVALVRAMDDICRIMGTNLSYTNGQVYPLWAVTNSYATNMTRPSTNTLLRINVDQNAADSATNFIPRALWAHALNADNGDPMNNNGPSNHWVEIWSSNAVGTNIQMNLIGRVGYLILNCSSLLDANYAGAPGSTRQYGTNPSEIEVAELGYRAVDVAKRQTAVRYESLEELLALNGSGFNPSNFVTYSYFPNGSWSNLPLVDLAGAWEDLETRKTNIIAAFETSGFSTLEAGLLYSNLLDYVDGDLVPQNLVACVEPVPMLNELVLSCWVEDLGAGAYRVHNRVQGELWYPFVAGSGTGSFELAVSFPGSACPVINQVSNVVLSPGQILAVPFPETVEDVAASPAAPYQFRINTARVRQGPGGPVLDCLDAPVQIAVPVGQTSVWQCVDPRFNFSLAANWTNTGPATLGNTNSVTLAYWNSHPTNDTEAAMYVANESLHSVGELGYLTCAPWRTVKLYGPDSARVFDVFALGTNAADTNLVRRGLVNPNWEDDQPSEVLAAAYAGMRVDRCSGDPAPAGVLSMTDARELARRFWDSGMMCTNLSDFGRGLTNFDGLSFPVGNELQREAFFRNACDLMSPRQNLFTIIIEAHVASGGSIPRNAARQRAVAVVWRDPYTGEFFVRSFQWLED